MQPKKSWPEFRASFIDICYLRLASKELDRSGSAALVAPGVFVTLRGVVVRESIPPIVHLPFRFIFGNTIAFLNQPYELVFLAAQRLHIVICKFAPLGPGFTCILLPLSFDLIPVH